MKIVKILKRISPDCNNRFDRLLTHRPIYVENTIFVVEKRSRKLLPHRFDGTPGKLVHEFW